MKKRNIAFIISLMMLLSVKMGAQTVVDGNNQFEILSQSLYECLYTYNVQVNNKSGEPISELYNTILQIGNSCAKFSDYTTYLIDSLEQNKNVEETIRKEYQNKKYRALYHFDIEVYHNFPQGKMTIIDVITPNIFTYKEDSPLFKWELLPDTMTVCGYVCNKAIAEYGGRKWIAWYAPNIPVSYGPWKFAGLPGLVLEATDSEGIHKFIAISLRKNKTTCIVKEKNAKLVSTDRDKFVKNKNYFEKDPMHNIPVESISQMQVIRYGNGPQDKTAFINGVQLRIRPNGYIPLEFK